MTTKSDDVLREFHWLMDVLHNIDAGLVVLDRDCRIKLWNSFMQNHSAQLATDVLEHSIFSVFPELPESWFRRKLRSVTVLRNAAFTTWEQRQYLFRFKNYRPVTGSAEYMYQNCTILPLLDTRGEVSHICLIVYDVTETAVNRLQLQQANAQLRAISRTDGLTGLLNRQTWEEVLSHEFRRFQRYRSACSLIMFDIDHFKRVNDTFGHPAGDQVIRLTAKNLLKSIRKIDSAGRYGGEEFAIILADTGGSGARVVAERLRSTIENDPANHDGKAIAYTISLGVCELSDAITSPKAWIEAADQALYKAKHRGRNCTEIFTDEPP